VKRTEHILAFSVLWLASCGAPPPTPQLPKHSTQPIERVLLDDSIDASDIRQVFDALNESEKLNGISPWLSRATDTELAKMGTLINTHLFQPALDHKGLISLLSDRVNNRSFSRAIKEGIHRTNPETRRAFADLLMTALRSPYWIDLVERDIRYFSPELDRSIEAIQEDFQKAWSYEETCAAGFDPIMAVDDIRRFLATPGLRDEWISFTHSLSDSWPIVGILRAVREVDRKHNGKAFDGMGSGFTKMIQTPLDESKGPLPTQFDAFLDLLLALNGPSDGLFASLQSKLENDKEFVRELGSIIQPNLANRIMGYMPLVSDTLFDLFIADLQKQTLGKAAWVNVASSTANDAASETLGQVYVAGTSAHQLLVGQMKDASSPDYVKFNLPIILNNYVLTQWLGKVVQANSSALQALSETDFDSQLWDLPVTSPAFSIDFTEASPTGDVVFSASRMNALGNFADSAFSDALSKNRPEGLGQFAYEIPELSKRPLREAIRAAMDAIDESNGYADGSPALRLFVYSLISKRNGKSFLENMESENLLTAAHRFLSSMPKETWKSIRGILFDGAGMGSLSADSKQFLLSFYENNPSLSARFSRVLDSLGMLRALDSTDGKGLSAFEAYQEIVAEVGPVEWKALGDAWTFLGNSKLFSMELDASGKAVPRFPSAFSLISSGNTSGLFRLASQLEPGRYHALAEFLDRAVREKEGVQGSALHWDFLQELVEKSPNGVAVLIDSVMRSGGVSLRDALTVEEREWLVEFVEDGSLRTLWQMIGPKLLEQAAGSKNWLSELKKLSADGTLKNTFQMLSLVKSDRMKAIAKFLQNLESSGELTALLEYIDITEDSPAN
jgi:hypothetical protein